MTHITHHDPAYNRDLMRLLLTTLLVTNRIFRF